MPLYEFECDECGFVFTHIMKHEEKEAVIGSNCPMCTDGIVKSNVSASNFKINGYSEANGYSKAGKRV